MPSRSPTSRSADHLRLVVPPAAAGAVAVARAATSAKSGSAAAAAKSKVASTAGKAVGDWIWHGLGIGAATASAGFATYAMIFSTGEVVPSGNFNIFARYDRLYQAPGAHHAPPSDVAATTPPDGAARVETADKDAVDFTPTGSVGAPAGLSSQGRSGSRAAPSYTLRDVFDGKALVESKASLSVVKPGSILEGAGEVLSIEKRGEQWVVMTRNGMITGQRH